MKLIATFAIALATVLSVPAFAAGSKCEACCGKDCAACCKGDCDSCPKGACGSCCK